MTQHQHRPKAFTLIEITVTLAVLAVLAAVAVVAFGGTSASQDKRAGDVALDTARATAVAVSADTRVFPGMPATLTAFQEAVRPANLVSATTPASGAAEMSFGYINRNAVVVATAVAPGDCHSVLIAADGAAQYASSSNPAGGCTAQLLAGCAPDGRTVAGVTGDGTRGDPWQLPPQGCTTGS